MNLYDEIDLYKILELNNNANNDEIKKSYKRLILKYHPDKNKNIKSDKFIKIKYAYDILSNKNTKEKYDLKRIYLNNNYLNIFEIIKNIYLTKNYLIIFKILINKIIFLEDINILKEKIIFNDKLFSFNNLVNIINNIDFTIKQIWDNEPQILNYNRITKNIFNEYIYPTDKKQIYENEGEKIILDNNNLEGDFIVNINLINNIYNNEIYYINNNDLFICIKEDRINKNKISIKYLDDINHEFKLINKGNSIFGELYYIDNIGLPYYNTNEDIIDLKLNKNFVMYGKLFFILLL
jgi:curved DNA-binding protein CbpA